MKNANIQISRKQQIVIPNYNGIIEGKNNISGISTTSSSSEIDGTPKKYILGKILGTGSFGIVCEVTDIDNGQRYALKKVLQDPRYKNRELDIMKILDHPNIIKLIDYFYTTGDEEPMPPQPPTDDINYGDHIGRNIIHSNNNIKSKISNKFLNVIMEYIPETLYRVSKSFIRSGNIMPINIVSIYIYQLFRAVGFLHSLGICHRDIKPQNLLVDTKNNTLKLCDFGSAKRLIPNELSVAYICSRFYRAPELMLGATEYTPNIDLWSIGCVFGELILGKPLFSGETSIDQLVKIIQVLGTPTKEQMIAMNPHYTEVRFPTLKAKDWKKILPDNTPSLAIDLLQKILRYEPNIRIKPYEAMAHPFFDNIRESHSQNPIIVQSIGNTTPELFNFSKYELSIIPDYLLKKILPNNYNIEF
ncbi:protein kinase domain-containing protein [Cryptosporidium serpentis]